MKPCEIYHVSFEGSFVWKWRQRQPDGRVIESEEKYTLYYECVSAALQRGYLPNVRCFTPADGAVQRVHSQT